MSLPSPGLVDSRRGAEEKQVEADRLLIRHLQDDLEQLRRRCGPEQPRSEEWERFLQVYTRLFARLVRDRRWPEADRDDGVQELWLMLVARLPGFRYDPGLGRLRDWILAAARHRLADQERRRRCRPAVRLGPRAGTMLPGREPDPALTSEQEDLRERVRNATAELRPRLVPRDWEAFRLRWFEGLGIREIARRLGMTEGEVWSSHHRTIVKLRPLLVRRLGPEPFA